MDLNQKKTKKTEKIPKKKPEKIIRKQLITRRNKFNIFFKISLNLPSFITPSDNICLLCSISSVAFATTFTFIPIYATSINASDMENGYLAAAMFTFAGIGSLAVPYLLKKIKFGWLLVLAFVVVACSVGIVPFIEQPNLLIVSQAFGGFGRGMINVQLMTLAVVAVPLTSRATSMGIYQAIYAIGMLTGPLAAGFIGEYMSVAWVFGVSTGVTVLSAFVAWYFLSKQKLSKSISDRVQA